MKREEINIRDPFVLLHEDVYYLYGTRSDSCWDRMDGFDCYVSRDLEEFEGPVEVFHRPEGFFADRCYWAPECYALDDGFYLITTLASETVKKGIYVLKSDSPTGPFLPYGGRLTPEDWNSIDGTLYMEDGRPFLIFSHSVDGEDSLRGDFCMTALSNDLKAPVSDPVCLFSAADTPWAVPVPFAEAEFGIREACYLSDGPCLRKWNDGRLYMVLSSWSSHGYAVGVAVSDSGRLAGPWRQQQEPLFPENGGHGMLFEDRGGRLVFALHYPNDKYRERPVFRKICVAEGRMFLDPLASSWITNGTDRPFYARRSFAVSGTVLKAAAHVCGLGQFNFYLNGEKVSDHVLDPGWTDYRKAVQYLTFDVTGLLQPGENAAGIEVGNGWYIMETGEGHGYSFHFPPFMPPNPNPYVPFGRSLVAAVTLEITYEDGRSETLTTDETWTTAPHAVVWSNVYGSEHMSGSRKQEGFSLPGFDESGWMPAKKAAPDEAPEGQPVPQMHPPVRVIRTYEARELTPAGGKRVFDLGQNISGLLHAEVRGRAGDEVRFYPAEKLDAAGVPDQMAKGWMMIDNVISYEIARDGVWESVDQVFTYFAGRYIAVEGNADIRGLEGRAITSAWQEGGSFTCDNEKYNRIYDMIERTVEANMLGVHTDCPTIERFAWQEPNHLMGAAILFMKEGKALWNKFFFDMRAAQHTSADAFRDFEGNPVYPGDGLVPSQAPCYIPNVLPVPGMGSFYDIIAWGSAIILGVRWHYLFYGDEQVIRDNYEAGCRYLGHLKRMVTADGFICHGLGDWGNPHGDYARENVETAFLYADAKTLAEFAEILGRAEEAAALRSYADEVKKNYNEKLLIRDEEGRWCYRSWEKRDEGTVTTQAIEALPLYWGMVPPETEADVAGALKRALETEGALAAGEVGLPYVIQAASAHGMDDLIASFVTKDSHPSYYAFVLDGETTLGEYWEANPRSHCHDMMGHIIEWYYSGIAGIHIEEAGFAKVRIAPHMPADVSAFACTHDTPYGTLAVEGKRSDGAAQYLCRVPEGITVEAAEDVRIIRTRTA